MDVKAKLAALERKRVFLTAIGGLGTFGYLCVVGLLTDWSKLLGMEPNNVGDFLAGAFAPLAFLWLVIGYFIQALELKQNSESLMQQAAEMKHAVEQAADQASSLRANERYSRQSVLNETRVLYETELGTLAGTLCGNSGWTAFSVGPDPRELEWAAFNAGDREIFVKMLYNDLVGDDDEVRENISSYCRKHYGLDGFVDRCDIYIFTFNQFMEKLKQFDEGELVSIYSEYRPFGKLATVLRTKVSPLTLC